MHFKLGRKVLGALVSAAVMFSMIPGMVLADGEDGIVEVNAMVTSVTYNNPVTVNGITVSSDTNSNNSRIYTGQSTRFELPNGGNGTFTFKINQSGAYAGGEITGIEISVGTVSNVTLPSEGNTGWGDLSAGEALTWTAPETGSVNSVSLTLHGNNTYNNRRVTFSAIKVYVRVPVTSITVDKAEEEYSYIYVGDQNYQLTATVSPSSTTYDDQYMTWTTDDEEGAVVSISEALENQALLTGVGYGSATITAAMGGQTGTFDIDVYEHVEDADINEDAITLDIDDTFTLIVEPTNIDYVHEGDWIVDWASDDEEIASVDENGIVTGLKDGTTVITATLYDIAHIIETEDEGVAPASFEVYCEVTVSSGPVVEAVAMYRLYNPNSGEHFYTADIAERDNLESLGWSYEGIGWIAPSISDTPVYRLYNPNAGEHHYTTDPAERDMLVEAGWNYEDIGWYSDDARTVPVYRQYNPNEFANNHNYTADENERNHLIDLGWRDEGTGWYAIARPLQEA